MGSREKVRIIRSFSIIGGIEEDNIRSHVLLYQNGGWVVVTEMIANRTAHALSTVRLKSSSPTLTTTDTILMMAASLVVAYFF